MYFFRFFFLFNFRVFYYFHPVRALQPRRSTIHSRAPGRGNETPPRSERHRGEGTAAAGRRVGGGGGGGADGAGWRSEGAKKSKMAARRTRTRCPRTSSYPLETTIAAFLARASLDRFRSRTLVHHSAVHVYIRSERYTIVHPRVCTSACVWARVCAWRFLRRREAGFNDSRELLPAPRCRDAEARRP